jgi:transcriptional regulator GlxA family with amidase domain
MAGLDLCLYVVECDFGSLVAVNLAKFAVVPIHRQGGQKQFIDHQYSTDNRNDIYHLISWMKENLTCDFSVDELASYACMAPRTLNRKFKNELGISPFEWLKLTRIRHAKLLLESTSLNIDQVSHNSGLGSSKNMRAQFKKVVGVTPTEYRKSFQRS